MIFKTNFKVQQIRNYGLVLTLTKNMSCGIYFKKFEGNKSYEFNCRWSAFF